MTSTSKGATGEVGQDRPPLRRRISHSQLHPCGLQTKFHRERAPRGPKGINLIYGIAVHAGIEHQAKHHQGADAAVGAARAALGAELARAEKGAGVRWDEPPRLTRKGEPFASDAHRLCTRETAEKMAAAQVRAWVEKFGEEPIEHTEATVIVKLERPRGWEIECRLDLITKNDWIWDCKTANESWTETKLDSAKGQAYLYMAAFRQKWGHKPAGFQFQVMPKGSLDIELYPVLWDRDAINGYLEHVVRAHIAAIEAGVYVPNTLGWWHSSKFCDWWDICPLGGPAVPDSQAEP